MLQTHNKKSKLVFLISLCLVFAVLYAVLGEVTQNKYNDSERSSLLNPKYQHNVASISVSQPGGTTVQLSACRNFWLGTTLDTSGETICFPVIQIQQCINEFSSLRTMYLLSDDINTAVQYGLAKNQALSISFSNHEQEILSHLYFGTVNHTGKRIRVKAAAGTSIYEIENNLFPWLTAEPKRWADMNIIPQSVFGSLDEKQIQRIRIGSTILSGGSEDIKNVAHILLTLRGADIIPVSRAGDLLFKIQLDTGDGTKIQLSIYTDKSQQAQFCIVPQIGGADSWPVSLHNAVQKLQYALSISEWTYNRILEIIPESFNEHN